MNILRFFMWFLTGVFIALGITCMYFTVQCVIAWVKGASVFSALIIPLVLTGTAYFLASDWLWNKSK